MQVHMCEFKFGRKSAPVSTYLPHLLKLIRNFKFRTFLFITSTHLWMPSRIRWNLKAEFVRGSRPRIIPSRTSFIVWRIFGLNSLIHRHVNFYPRQPTFSDHELITCQLNCTEFYRLAKSCGWRSRNWTSRGSLSRTWDKNTASTNSGQIAQ